MLEPVNFAKPVGAPALVEAVLRLQGEALAGVDGLRLEGADFALRGRAEFGAGSRLDRLVIAEGSRLGGSRFGGEIRRPAREGGPWAVTLRGPLLDLRPILSAPSPRRRGRPRPPGARRPRLPIPARAGARATPSTCASTARPRARAARCSASAPPRWWTGAACCGRRRAAAAPRRRRRRPQHGGAFEVTLTPRGRGERHLRLTAEDGGALLHALDLADAIQGGRLTVTASTRSCAPALPCRGWRSWTGSWCATRRASPSCCRR
jgi:hypothetical protein